MSQSSPVPVASRQPHRILITDRPWPDCQLERDVLQSLNVDIVEAPDASEATLLKLAVDADVIGTCWAPLTSAVIRAATRCRLICRFGIGLDNIDIAVASQLGILVTNNPDYCIDEVSNHTLALLLGWMRQIARFDRDIKSGIYDLQAAPPMQRIAGKTLGLLGLGPIARAVVPKAQAFGMRVVAHTPSGNDYQTGCTMLPWDELLEVSDVVSIHAPLNDATRLQLNADAFDKMKPTALLINTSRGGIIDHRALWDAICNQQIAGAALDVFDPEPPDLTHPLFSDARVLTTPHAAFLSVESLSDLRTQTAIRMRDFLTGKQPSNVANPEALANSR